MELEEKKFNVDAQEWLEEEVVLEFGADLDAVKASEDSGELSIRIELKGSIAEMFRYI